MQEAPQPISVGRPDLQLVPEPRSRRDDALAYGLIVGSALWIVRCILVMRRG